MDQIDWMWLMQIAPPWWQRICFHLVAFAHAIDADLVDEEDIEEIRDFARAMPSNLSLVAQDDFCGLFCHALHGERENRIRLMMLFRDNLSQSTDTLSNDPSLEIVRDFASEGIDYLAPMDRIQTEIETFTTNLEATQEATQALKDIWTVRFKWSIDNSRANFPQIMGLFQGYLCREPTAVPPDPRLSFVEYTHHLTAPMWQRIYQARPNLIPQAQFAPPPVQAPAFVWAVEIPPWFETAMYVERMWPQRQLLESEAAQSSRALLEACDYAYDMLNLQVATNDVTERVSSIINEFVLEVPADDAGHNAIDLLNQSMEELKSMYFLQEQDTSDFSLEDVLVIRERLEREEGMLNQVRARTFQAERYLLDKEASMLADGENFLAAALRYERCKYREFFRSAVATLKTERLKEVDYAADILHSWDAGAEPLVVPAFDEDHMMCPICHEDLPENGEVAAGPVVTRCCQRPFHTQCLLSWLLQQLHSEDSMTCPLCRAEVNYASLANVLETEVRRMDIL
ncbi:hypothetical protein AYO21_05731 [Fonsecaea monophora]|uniref:RING-type domain-containing protein n=1 Tax=Fonsecaea monophora TaxID=254056 RepID=A0A177F8X6_9EURO|nr:hypothetical protein AYO21_05731 [Fonsecaea monophora]OAG40050.1 hypothetical protein AYO21_05731 [Fonsecaea monophora]